MTTGSVVSPDATFTDALFLVNNPSWTWADLQATPVIVVELMRQIQHGREKVEAARAGKE